MRTESDGKGGRNLLLAVRVLGIDLVGEEYVAFQEEEPGVQVMIPLQVWHDFGEPDTVTVTIEKGDHLNEEGT